MSIKLTGEELKWLSFMYESYREIEVSRKSLKEFDLRITGIDSNGIRFSAWMPLGLIHSLDWDDDEFWSLSDGYGPKGFIPSQGKDWSGIRDSSDETIWKMFEIAQRSFIEELGKNLCGCSQE